MRTLEASHKPVSTIHTEGRGACSLAGSTSEGESNRGVRSPVCSALPRWQFPCQYSLCSHYTSCATHDQVQGNISIVIDNQQDREKQLRLRLRLRTYQAMIKIKTTKASTYVLSVAVPSAHLSSTSRIERGQMRHTHCSRAANQQVSNSEKHDIDSYYVEILTRKHPVIIES